jgi:hypothetical protein
MSRYKHNVNEHREIIYGCDDFGYYYLIFDDKKGIPEDEFLIEKEENVDPDKFYNILIQNKIDPENHILDLIKHNIVI